MKEGGGAEAPWTLQKWPPSLQICRMTSRPRKNVSMPLATFPSLSHFVSTPRILISACCFYIFLTLNGWTNQKSKYNLHSRLRNSFKNHLINKFEILIHFKFFFVKSLHKNSSSMLSESYNKSTNSRISKELLCFVNCAADIVWFVHDTPC